MSHPPIAGSISDKGDNSQKALEGMYYINSEI